MYATSRIQIDHSTLTFHIVDLLVSGKEPRNSEDMPRSPKPLQPSRELKKWTAKRVLSNAFLLF